MFHIQWKHRIKNHCWQTGEEHQEKKKNNRQCCFCSQWAEPGADPAGMSSPEALKAERSTGVKLQSPRQSAMCKQEALHPRERSTSNGAGTSQSSNAANVKNPMQDSGLQKPSLFTKAYLSKHQLQKASQWKAVWRKLKFLPQMVINSYQRKYQNLIWNPRTRINGIERPQTLEKAFRFDNYREI